MRFFSVNQNLLSKSRIFSFSPAGLGRKTLVLTPGVVGDLKPINKSMLLISHFYSPRPTTDMIVGSVAHSLLSTELNSWKLDNLDVPSCGHEQDWLRINNSCNGLALLLFHEAERRNDPVKALWNPKTNKIIPIPRSHIPLPSDQCWEEEFLGFDPASQDFKVTKFLRFVDDEHRSHFLAQLYSLKSDSWKEIAFPFYCLPKHDHHSIYINGVFYWATTYDHCFIGSFDFANEKFSSAPHIPLPENVHRIPAIPLQYAKKSWLLHGFILVEFYGLLAAVLHSQLRLKTDVPELLRKKTKPFDFEIWVWNDESWSKVVSKIAIDALNGVSKVLGLFNNETLILQGLEGELLLFNWKTRVLENIKIKIDADISSQFEVLHYVPM